MSQLAPPDVLRGMLRVLYVAGYTTRNWTLSEEIFRKQINHLWEAVHEIPSEVTRWNGTEDFERKIEMYFVGYNQKWKFPNLMAIYLQAKKEVDL